MSTSLHKGPKFSRKPHSKLQACVSVRETRNRAGVASERMQVDGYLYTRNHTGETADSLSVLRRLLKKELQDFAVFRREAEAPAKFTQYPELLYCLTVAILVFLYSSFQLFKGVCDIAHRGIIIPDKISDYLTFILDQLVGYLLASSSSISIPVIVHMEKRTASIWRATVVSASMSFATLVLVAICALLSGYRLCKRIIW